MQIVIDISEDAYEQLIEAGELDYLEIISAIENGTLLPKGHGRLIDADKLRDKCQKEYDFYVDAYGGFENMSENDKARADHIISVIADIVNAETIIEADNG